MANKCKSPLVWSSAKNSCVSPAKKAPNKVKKPSPSMKKNWKDIQREETFNP